MEGIVPIVLACVSVAYTAANAIYAAWTVYRRRRKDKQINNMEHDIKQVIAAMAPPPALDLEEAIHMLFDELKAHPTEEVHRKLVELINKKQTELMNSIQFSTVEEFITKTELVAHQFSEMLTKAKAVLETRPTEVAKTEK